MRLIKFTHACVRLERDDRVLVIDPGVFSEDEAYDGASHILITHEHADHVNPAQLVAAQATNPDLRVYTNAGLAAQLTDLGDAVVTVAPGDRFDAGGFAVEAVGGAHAEIYDALPGCENLGYVVDGTVYHPGDSLFVPESKVSTLLVPLAAPWLKTAEAIDFVRAVAPARAYPIHDGMLADFGHQVTDRWISMKGGTEYARIPIGGSVDI
jgi:L-ascorbate metabolism protein UlaG (beta-lactamase superfamily)